MFIAKYIWDIWKSASGITVKLRDLTGAVTTRRIVQRVKGSCEKDELELLKTTSTVVWVGKVLVLRQIISRKERFRWLFEGKPI